MVTISIQGGWGVGGRGFLPATDYDVGVAPSFILAATKRERRRRSTEEAHVGLFGRRKNMTCNVQDWPGHPALYRPGGNVNVVAPKGTRSLEKGSFGMAGSDVIQALPG